MWMLGVGVSDRLIELHGMDHKYKTNNQYCINNPTPTTIYDRAGETMCTCMQHRRWKNCPPAVFNLELIISILGGNVGVGKYYY